MPGANIGEQSIRRIRYMASIHYERFQSAKIGSLLGIFPPNTRKDAKVCRRLFFIRVFCVFGGQHSYEPSACASYVFSPLARFLPGANKAWVVLDAVA